MRNPSINIEASPSEPHANKLAVQPCLYYVWPGGKARVSNGVYPHDVDRGGGG